MKGSNRNRDPLADSNVLSISRLSKSNLRLQQRSVNRTVASEWVRSRLSACRAKDQETGLKVAERTDDDASEGRV
jgi:hypothetical protein